MLAVAAALLVTVALWPFEPELSARDLEEITALVRQETAYPIAGVRPISFMRVEVTADNMAGGLAGQGMWITLRWSFGTWRVTDRRLWVN